MRPETLFLRKEERGGWEREREREKNGKERKEKKLNAHVWTHPMDPELA